MWRKKNEIKIFPKFFKTRCPKSTCFTVIMRDTARESSGHWQNRDFAKDQPSPPIIRTVPGRISQ